MGEHIVPNVTCGPCGHCGESIAAVPPTVVDGEVGVYEFKPGRREVTTGFLLAGLDEAGFFTCPACGGRCGFTGTVTSPN